MFRIVSQSRKQKWSNLAFCAHGGEVLSSVAIDLRAPPTLRPASISISAASEISATIRRAAMGAGAMPIARTLGSASRANRA